jgi:hypothetical protein
MGIDCVPIDPVERDLAAAQLEDIALAFEGKPWAVWKDVVLRWHIDAVASARAQAWIPGMAGPSDPVVEQTLSRFYLHHMRVTIGHLRAENLDLRRRLVEAAAGARFYASGATDAGRRAQMTLAALAPYAAETAAGAARSH